MGDHRSGFAIHRQNAKSAVAGKGKVRLLGLCVENRVGMHGLDPFYDPPLLPWPMQLGNLILFSGRGGIPHRRYLGIDPKARERPGFPGVQQIR